jgi:hypothetical protein
VRKHEQSSISDSGEAKIGDRLIVAEKESWRRASVLPAERADESFWRSFHGS